MIKRDQAAGGGQLQNLLAARLVGANQADLPIGINQAVVFDLASGLKGIGNVGGVTFLLPILI